MLREISTESSALRCLVYLRQGIYQRIARWRKSLAPPNLAQLQAIEEEWNTPPAFSSSESTAPIEESPTTIDSPSESLLKGLAGNVADMSRHVGDDTTCRSNFGPMGPCRRHKI